MPKTRLSQLVKTSFNEGDVIYAVNDPSDCVYLVHSGTVQLESKQGMILGTLGEGELFGEVGLITAAPRTVTVRAKTKSVLIKVEEAVFLAKIREADPICGALIRGLALRINDANALAETYWRELALYKSIDH